MNDWSPSPETQEGKRLSSKAVARLAVLTSVVALSIGACGTVSPTATPSVAPTVSSASPAAAPTATPTAGPCVAPTFGPNDTPRGKSGQIINIGGPPHTIVRWYVGLGPGEDPAQIALQQTVVNDFNVLQDKRTDGVEPILLSLEIVQNDQAVDILKTEIASCNAPDLIGPVDIKGRASLPGEFLDMTQLIARAGYDMTRYPPALINTMKDGLTGALLGLPYAVYPSYIFYNRDIFDAAGLKYPPQKVGDDYEMPGGARVPWNWGTVRNIAMKLSLDTHGRNATQAGFDPTSQTQFGFEFQWTEGRRLASAFGSGSFVAADKKTAQFPDDWKTAWTWYYNGIWRDHFIANDAQRNSDLLAKGNVLSSGHAAMGHMFQWYICCMSAGGMAPGAFKRWDIAVMPANGAGIVTAPTDVDTFVIDRNTLAAPQAFEAMAYLMSRMDLLAIYGGTPATGDRLRFYRDNVDPPLAKEFPGNVVDWQVALDMEGYAGSPNNQASLPNDAKATADADKIFSTLAKTPGLDVDQIFTDVTTALQADFDAAT